MADWEQIEVKMTNIKSCQRMSDSILCMEKQFIPFFWYSNHAYSALKSMKAMSWQSMTWVQKKRINVLDSTVGRMELLLILQLLILGHFAFNLW